MSDWISALEASRLAEDARITRADLIEWARQGRLASRAQSGSFSNDDPCEEIPFANYRSDPWPDIPADFWDSPAKAMWGAGTFAARIEHWNEYEKCHDYEYIELFNVTFSKADLEGLLSGQPLSPAEVPRKRWQQKRATAAQAGAFKFIALAYEKPMKHPEGRVGLHNRYLEWHAEPKNKQTERPLGRPTFGKWQDRYLDGWRLDEYQKWVHNPWLS